MTWALLQGFLFGAEKSKQQTHWNGKHFIVITVISIVTTIMSTYNVLSSYQTLLYHLYLPGNKGLCKASCYYCKGLSFLFSYKGVRINHWGTWEVQTLWSAKDLWCFISRCSFTPLGPLLFDRVWIRMTYSRVDSLPWTLVSPADQHD